MVLLEAVDSVSESTVGLLVAVFTSGFVKQLDVSAVLIINYSKHFLTFFYRS